LSFLGCPFWAAQAILACPGTLPSCPAKLSFPDYLAMVVISWLSCRSLLFLVFCHGRHVTASCRLPSGIVTEDSKSFLFCITSADNLQALYLRKSFFSWLQSIMRVSADPMGPWVVFENSRDFCLMWPWSSMPGNT
jgi:hypothetical protein